MVLWVWYFSLRTMKMPWLPVLPMIWSHLEFASRLSWAQQSKCASMHQFFTVDLWNEVGHNLQHMYDTITDTIEVNMHPEMLVLPIKEIENYSTEPHTYRRWLSVRLSVSFCGRGRERAASMAKKTMFQCWRSSEFHLPALSSEYTFI